VDADDEAVLVGVALAVEVAVEVSVEVGVLLADADIVSEAVERPVAV